MFVPSISPCFPHCVYPTISCCVLILISMFFFLSCLIVRIHQAWGKSLWKPGIVVPAPLPSLSSMTLLYFSLVPTSTHPNHSCCPQMSWCPAWQGSPIGPQVTLPKSNVLEGSTFPGMWKNQISASLGGWGRGRKVPRWSCKGKWIIALKIKHWSWWIMTESFLGRHGV